MLSSLSDAVRECLRRAEICGQACENGHQSTRDRAFPENGETLVVPSPEPPVRETGTALYSSATASQKAGLGRFQPNSEPPFDLLAALDQEQEPGSASSEARGGRGLGP
jgi:hypothetical protein